MQNFTFSAPSVLTSVFARADVTDTSVQIVCYSQYDKYYKQECYSTLVRLSDVHDIDSLCIYAAMHKSNKQSIMRALNRTITSENFVIGKALNDASVPLQTSEELQTIRSTISLARRKIENARTLLKSLNAIEFVDDTDYAAIA